MEIKCQLDATEDFIADLIACSTCFGHHYAHHQELRSIIQWLLSVVFCAVVFKLLVWCGAEGHVSSLQDAQHAHITLSSTPDQQLENHSTKYHRQQPLYNTLELLMMWCLKHVEQAIRSAIKSSVASSWHFISTLVHLFIYTFDLV